MRAILTRLALLALPALPAAAGAAGTGADLLVYRVEEAGLEPYFSRFLVTADHLRMDEGEDAGGYTLYERSSGTIYNVDPAERTVLVINPPRARPPSPLDLELAEETVPAADLSLIDGVVPGRRRLAANGVVCEEVVAAPGVMPEATAALAEFYDRLADQHGTLVADLPEDLVDPCDLAQHVYAPRRAYSHGLPVEQRSGRVHRTLVDHAEGVPTAEALFEVPGAFRQIAMPNRAGAVTE
jgi:hypothetical protein